MGGVAVSKLKSQGKPFVISKWDVWEAFKRVKKNGGGPGVDGQTIEAFEADLQDNLYKVWNVRNECGEKVMCR